MFLTSTQLFQERRKQVLLIVHKVLVSCFEIILFSAQFIKMFLKVYEDVLKCVCFLLATVVMEVKYKSKMHVLIHRDIQLSVLYVEERNVPM